MLIDIVFNDLIQMVSILVSWKLLVYTNRKGIVEECYSQKLFWALNPSAYLLATIINWKYYGLVYKIKFSAQTLLMAILYFQKSEELKNQDLAKRLLDGHDNDDDDLSQQFLDKVPFQRKDEEIEILLNVKKQTQGFGKMQTF